MEQGWGSQDEQNGPPDFRRQISVWRRGEAAGIHRAEYRRGESYAEKELQKSIYLLGLMLNTNPQIYRVETSEARER